MEDENTVWHAVLNQENKIITMGDNNSEIRPNLYIDEFDVEARHSAIIGKFDKNEIFGRSRRRFPVQHRSDKRCIYL